jgi:hypothetical protein
VKRYENDLLNYPYTITIQRSHKKGQSDKKRLLCEDIFTFDIETTSFFYEQDKKPFLYHPGEDPEYWAGVYAGALPYIWQFGINDKYYYGRDIDDFYKLLDDFPKDLNIRIAVHNLSFEWHFLQELTWTNLFAKNTHKPIKARCSEYPNIEFYCTLSLTNRSLESWGDFLKVPKLVGFLDYNQMRTPLTPLQEKEFEYAERDLKVMYEGLKDELEVYGSVWKLPLTSTGKIRRIVKDLLMTDDDYKRYIKKLIPESAFQYKTSLKVFAGGYTHANRLFLNQVWLNPDGKQGAHVDYTSDYPFQMCCRKFPCSRWAYAGKVLPDPDTFEDIAYKMHVEFIGIKCQTRNTYIPMSKSECVNADVDNGRLIQATSCDIWITEQDYDIIRQMYTWEEVRVYEVWKAGKDYLPKKFVDYILQLFHDKTALKGVDDAECALAKARLNSLFGMCCTALLQATIEWNTEDEDWHIKRITENDINEHLKALGRWTDKRYFLNFDWGVWVCAYARHMLLNDIVIPYDKHVMYCDTDSAFLNKYIDFTEYNNSQSELLKKVCAERDLDYEKTCPKNKKGKRSYLGQLTYEEEFTEFKTLGAKRYVERWKCDNKLHMTIAGINKGAVSCLKNDINNFRDGLVFDKDEKDVSKLLHTYVENMPVIKFPDGYVSHQRRGVNLRPNGYKLTVDPTYNQLIGKIAAGYHVDQYENHLKSVWYDEIDEVIDQAWNSILK